MGHGKETPRQKMIGMMYLVLTAMLALNVSKDILDAFVIVDEGLEKTTRNFSQKNEAIYGEFDKKFAENETKVREWKEKADQVKEKCDGLYEKIAELKREIVTTLEGPESEAIKEDGHIDTKLISAKDNTDIPAQIMVGDNNNGKSNELKALIEEVKGYMLDIIPETNSTLRNAVEENLSTEDPPPGKDGVPHTWESEHFEHLPTIAVLTLMTKMQGDVRNVEADMTRFLFNQINAGSFAFNKLEATVIPNSSYIIKGNQYEADVFIAAFDTTQQPTVYIGNYETSVDEDGNTEFKMVGRYDSLMVENGKGKYKPGIAGSTGLKKWGGLIKLKHPDGTDIYRPFQNEYQVAEPNLVISPTKMNVFYVGVDNPVDVSVAGVPADKIFPNITNGKISPSNKGGYTVRPKRPGISLVTVMAEIGGVKKKMGTMEFRVKRVPSPVALLAGKKGGRIKKNMLLSQLGIRAEMENFDFDLKFRITGFSISAVVAGYTKEEASTNSRFTDGQKNLIKGLNKKDKIFISDIKAVGPDGSVRDLSPMKFELN